MTDSEWENVVRAVMLKSAERGYTQPAWPGTILAGLVQAARTANGTIDLSPVEWVPLDHPDVREGPTGGGDGLGCPGKR